MVVFEKYSSVAAVDTNVSVMPLELETVHWGQSTKRRPTSAPSLHILATRARRKCVPPLLACCALYMSPQVPQTAPFLGASLYTVPTVASARNPTVQPDWGCATPPHSPVRQEAPTSCGPGFGIGLQEAAHRTNLQGVRSVQPRRASPVPSSQRVRAQGSGQPTCSG